MRGIFRWKSGLNVFLAEEEASSKTHYLQKLIFIKLEHKKMKEETARDKKQDHEGHLLSWVWFLFHKWHDFLNLRWGEMTKLHFRRFFVGTVEYKS